MENHQLEDLASRVKTFCEARDWDQFHSPKDLAIGLVTESSELLELFRFKSREEAQQICEDVQKRREVGDELADILFFLLRFSERNGFNLEECLLNKMKKNAKKYPVEQAKGSNKKYSEF